MKIKSEVNSGGRIFMMSSHHKEIGTVELHHYTTYNESSLLLTLYQPA
jgi:hypothetical protein